MSKILVPFDHSENAFIALQQAMYIAQNNRADIEVFHVINLLISRDIPMQWTEDDEQAIKESLQSKIDVAKSLVGLSSDINISVFLQRGERVVDEVLMRAKEADTVLIVMGTHGVTGFIDKVMGTNSLDVLNDSTYPLLLIPPHWKPERIDQLVLAIELKDLVTVINKANDIKTFMNLPLHAVQLTALSDVKEVELRELEGITFEYIDSRIDKSLADNLRDYTQNLHHTILIMFTHPRKLLQKIFSKSLTQDTAKVIEIPLLSIKTE